MCSGKHKLCPLHMDFPQLITPRYVLCFYYNKSFLDPNKWKLQMNPLIPNRKAPKPTIIQFD